MIEVLKVIGTMLNVSFESRGHSCCSLSCRLFLITNLMLEGQHSDPAAGWIEDKAELPGGDTNRRGEMYWYHTDSHYKWIKNEENKCDPTLEKKKCLFFFLTWSPFRHQTPDEEHRQTLQSWIYISGSFKSGVGVLFFFSGSQKKREPRREGRRQTVKVKEEKFVCSFFPLSRLTTLISFSLSLTLSVAVCLPRSCLYRHFLFGLISPQWESLVVILTPHSL